MSYDTMGLKNKKRNGVNSSESDEIPSGNLLTKHLVLNTSEIISSDSEEFTPFLFLFFNHIVSYDILCYQEPLSVNY